MIDRGRLRNIEYSSNSINSIGHLFWCRGFIKQPKYNEIYLKSRKKNDNNNPVLFTRYYFSFNL